MRPQQAMHCCHEPRQGTVRLRHCTQDMLCTRMRHPRAARAVPAAAGCSVSKMLAQLLVLQGDVPACPTGHLRCPACFALSGRGCTPLQLLPAHAGTPAQDTHVAAAGRPAVRAHVLPCPLRLPFRGAPGPDLACRTGSRVRLGYTRPMVQLGLLRKAVFRSRLLCTARTWHRLNQLHPRRCSPALRHTCVLSRPAARSARASIIKQI